MFTNHIIKYIPDTNPDSTKAAESIATQIRDIVLATHPGLTASNDGSSIWISLYGNRIFKIANYISYVRLLGDIDVGYINGFRFDFSPSSYSEYKFTVYQTNDTILFKKGHMPSLEGLCLGLLRSTSGEWFYYMCPMNTTLLYFMYYNNSQANKKCIFRPSTRELLTLQDAAFANVSYIGMDLTYIPAAFTDSQGNNITFKSVKSVINTGLVSGHYTDDQNRFYCLEINTPIMLMS